MDYREFFKKMQDGGLVSADWRNVLGMIDEEYDNADKEEYLKTLVLHFSLIDDGNVFMSLDKQILVKKFEDKIKGIKIQSKEDDEIKDKFYDELNEEINTVIENTVDINNFTDIVAADGSEKLFAITEDRIFTRKHINSVNSIADSVKRIFLNNPIVSTDFDYRNYVTPDFRLSSGQEKIIKLGEYNNLFITGGPGTGKTTSVFFLLLSLLIKNPDNQVYLTAPSGKAASRMKDSILSSASRITNTDNIEVIEKIKGLGEYTIHRLLGYDPIKNRFTFGSKNQFPAESIFVIDEASMIDVSIFAALLEAIPNEARVFILGDKNQLPSVECGAVFGDLLSKPSLSSNIVELDESKRFDVGSDIYKLAEVINSGGDLSYIENEWKSAQDFEITEKGINKTPIYYYLDKNDTIKDTDMIDHIAKKWYEKFYKEKNLIGLCSQIKLDEAEDADLNIFDSIWKICENARILCASNKGTRGICHINQTLLKEFYSKMNKISGFYPGELLIVTQNNKVLDLYNGDCGVTVQFDGDDTLYLMLKKSTNLCLDDKKIENGIFKIGDYLFYPIRLISSEDILPAFAITIHKSQGSDYDNILVVLPKSKGHPLLNRQLLYTAITRTKGATYILSNQENIECARDTVLIRDTGIVL